MDRHNGVLFLTAYLLIYFGAPVSYIGVVQAALCDKLGASATVANLPAAANLVGHVAPIFIAWAIPFRLERAVLVGSNAAVAVFLGVVFTALILPIAAGAKIAIVIGQSLIVGFISGVSSVYMYQCLGRGTTSEGRARALRRTFAFGPLAAVAGSLGAQFVLSGGVAALPFPYDFALLYLVGIPCRLGVAAIFGRFRMVDVPEESRPSFWAYMLEGWKSFTTARDLAVLWLGYFFWYCTMNAMPNLSLFTREAIGRDPKELSGLIMAIRFGFKCLGGWMLGGIALRWGARAPVTTTVVLAGTAALWTWMVPGYLYLFAFGLLGAGELGGAYIPNYCLAISTPVNGAAQSCHSDARHTFVGHRPSDSWRPDGSLRVHSQLCLCNCHRSGESDSGLETPRATQIGVTREKINI